MKKKQLERDEGNFSRKKQIWFTSLFILTVLTILGVTLLKFLISGAHGTLETHWQGSKVDRDYLSSPEVGEENVTPAIRNALKKNRLRVIEFCESGQFWDRKVKQAAVDFVDKAAYGANVYLFVHGWNHNGDPTRENGDLNRFSKFLEFLNNEDNSGKAHVGVFIAWPGDAIMRSKFSRVVSFPGKRAATRRVASPNLADCIYQIRRKSNRENKRLILIGHSFGGRVVERLVSPSIQSFYNYKRNQVEIGGVSETDLLVAREDILLADLTIIINPASEGLHCRMLKLATENWPYEEFPALFSLTSETDVRTSETWYFGKTFERMIVPTVVQKQRILELSGIENESVVTYLNHTAGHDRRLLSSKISKDNSNDGDFILQKALDPPEEFRSLLFPTVSEVERQNPPHEDSKLYGEGANEHTLPSGGYFVARLDHDILNGHNGGGPKDKISKGITASHEDLENTIFNHEMRKLLLFLVSGLEDESECAKEIRRIRKELDLIPGGYKKIPDLWISPKLQDPD